MKNATITAILLTALIPGVARAADTCVVAVMGDTHTENVSGQVSWIMQNAASRNIRLFTQMGDAVNNGNLGEWGTASTAYAPLLRAVDGTANTSLLNNLAVSFSMGNHDMTSYQSSLTYTSGLNWVKGNSTNWRGTLSTGKNWARYPWFKSVSPNGNNYAVDFTYCGRTFRHISLEWDFAGSSKALKYTSDNITKAKAIRSQYPAVPTSAQQAALYSRLKSECVVVNQPASDADLSWLTNILNNNKDKPTIISTHDFWPGTGSSLTGVGTALWNRVKNYSQVFMVIGGHVDPNNPDAKMVLSRSSPLQPVYVITLDLQNSSYGTAYTRMLKMTGEFTATVITSTVEKNGTALAGFSNKSLAGSVNFSQYASGSTPPPTNTAPVVNAGADKSITLPINSVSLAGTATDDGLPSNTLTKTWTATGPAVVAFSAANALATNATFSVAGTYTLKLTASDGTLSSFDTVVVTVSPAVLTNTPPVVSAGADKSITLPANVLTVYGTATDDGRPNNVVTKIWTATGPAAVTFSAANALTTNATFSVAGTYTLKLTASDGSLSSFDTTIVTVNPAPAANVAPVANAGIDKTATLGTAGSVVVAMTGSATDDGKPVGSALTKAWTKKSGPAAVTFSAPSAVNSNVTFTVAGTYVLTLTASDGALSASDDVQVIILPRPTTAFVRRVNLNGAAATIGGNAWLSYADALTKGLTFSTTMNVASTAITPVPAVDAATNAMLNTCVWSSGSWGMAQTVTNGNYKVYLWVMENYLSNSRSFDVKLEGVTTGSAIGSLAKGAWKKYGPYSVTVADGKLNIDFIKVTGHPHVMGIEVTQVVGIAALNQTDNLFASWLQLVR